MKPNAPFNAAESLYAGLTVVRLFRDNSRLTGISADETTDVLTLAAHGLYEGQLVKYISGTGGTGLTAGNQYYVRDVTENTFKLSATLDGTAVDITAALTVGIIDPFIVFAVPQVDMPEEQEEAILELPDENGVLREVRSVLKKQQENFTFQTPEPRRLVKIFNGALGGRVTGTATLWVPDVDDAEGLCALVSEEDFACVVTRDGAMTFGGGEFSQPTLKLKSQKKGSITWTVDADIT